VADARIPAGDQLPTEMKHDFLFRARQTHTEGFSDKPIGPGTPPNAITPGIIAALLFFLLVGFLVLLEALRGN